MYQRYAIYVTPEGGLADAGAAWLGWDVARGQSVRHPFLDGIDIAAVTEVPRKYGMHGTIKPPFFLAENMTADALEVDVAALCARLPKVEIQGLDVAAIAGFVALTPRGDQSGLSKLAARVVMELDHFRAPPSQAELARRRKNSLSPAQDAHLMKWGYPYVLDEFRFHITLSGRVDDPAALAKRVQPYFAPHLPKPFVVDSLTLVGQDAAGMFHQLRRCSLAG